MGKVVLFSAREILHERFFVGGNFPLKLGDFQGIFSIEEDIRHDLKIF